MEKIKSLLLPLALIFSAIAVFEFGASRLKSRGWSKEGDPIVVITKMYAGEKLIDSTQIRAID